MTIGEALERAEQLRPNCRIETETRLQWLREADALLRTKLFDRAAAGAFDAVGADRPWEQPVQDDQTLLAPPPFDALYPHLLCAQMDADFYFGLFHTYLFKGVTDITVGFGCVSALFENLREKGILHSISVRCLLPLF